MRSSPCLSLLLNLNAIFMGTVLADGPTWLRNLDKASQDAKTDGKDLFVVFTGHGWCRHCEVLYREVFRQQEFSQLTSNDFVLVELDFNFGDSAKEQQRKAKLMSLRSRFLAPTVPTVVLANAEGVPYAYITDYESGTGPRAFLAKVASARRAREKLEELLAQAESYSGDSKAKILSDALTCIAPQLGEIDERGDDPLLQFYGDVIDNILDLTHGKGSMAEKFTALRKKRNAWLGSDAVLEKLEDFKSSKDYAGAVNYIDSIALSQELPELRWRLELSRQVFLEWDDKHQEAIVNCRRLLALRDISEKHREQLLDREAFNLFQLDRIDEGLSHFDHRIKNAGSDFEKRLRLLSSKSQMILGRDPVERSIAVWRTYREATESGTEDWIDATYLLAHECHRADLHQDAIQLLNDVLRHRREAWIWLDAAESHIALGNSEEALQFITEAETQAEKLKVSQRKADRDTYDRLRDRILALKDDLAVGALKTATEPSDALKSQ